jgi:hypothetical protein
MRNCLEINNDRCNRKALQTSAATNGGPMKELLDKLKAWLKERQDHYVHVNDWQGDTESGFYSTEEFDFDDLCKQIDEFGEELRSSRGAAKDQS